MKRLTICIFVLLTLFPALAQAQVFVKPSGHKAVPVRVSSLSADVEISGAIAITDWSMKVQLEDVGNGGYEGGISDWVMARPTDAKVTAFQVTQWGQTLEGHVVPKAVALPRATFAAAPNDPLLRSGLNARNSFRASVYPISSWNEVVVSGTWVQVLDSAQGRAQFRLPLLALRGATTRLAELKVKVTVRESNLAGLSNNYGLPARSEKGARVFALSQKNYRVTRDLTFAIARNAAPTQGTLLLDADADNKGGHFALAVPNSAGAKLSSAGTNASELVASERGATELLTGAYRGDARQLRFQVTRDGKTRDLQPVRGQNSVASALWATQQINAWGNAPARKAEVIRLSRAYDVESVYTSWLTVADDELKFYERALVDAQLDVLVREYWMRIGEGQEKGARVAQLGKSIALISKVNHLKAEDEIYIRLGSALNYAASQGWYYGSAPTTKAQKRFANLDKYMTEFAKKLSVKTSVSDPSYPRPAYAYTRDELYDLRGKIMGEYSKPHPDYAQLETWQHRFALLYGSTDIDPRLNFWRAQIKARELETQTSAAEKAGDTVRLAQLQNARNQNSGNAYFVNNIGDPPIYVQAPANAKSVVAVMPDGAVKTLEYNADAKRWEGNYDVPTTTAEGLYTIQILIVGADNARRRYGLQFRVDTTPPRGTGQVLLAPPTGVNGARAVRLQIEHGGDVARVTALLPWGEKVALLPSTTHSQRFFALVKTPPEYVGKAIEVTYILVDRAHNFTTIQAESVASDAASADSAVAAP